MQPSPQKASRNRRSADDRKRRWQADKREASSALLPPPPPRLRRRTPAAASVSAPAPPFPSRSFLLGLVSSSSFASVRFHSTQRARVVAHSGLVQPNLQHPIALSRFKIHHTMLAYAALAVLIAGSILVRADPVPTAPGPGDVFKVGGQCSFTWTADTTGTWKEMNVELIW